MEVVCHAVLVSPKTEYRPIAAASMLASDKLNCPSGRSRVLLAPQWMSPGAKSASSSLDRQKVSFALDILSSGTLCASVLLRAPARRMLCYSHLLPANSYGSRFRPDCPRASAEVKSSCGAARSSTWRRCCRTRRRRRRTGRRRPLRPLAAAPSRGAKR